MLSDSQFNNIRRKLYLHNYIITYCNFKPIVARREYVQDVVYTSREKQTQICQVTFSFFFCFFFKFFFQFFFFFRTSSCFINFDLLHKISVLCFCNILYQYISRSLSLKFLTGTQKHFVYYNYSHVNPDVIPCLVFAFLV